MQMDIIFNAVSNVIYHNIALIMNVPREKEIGHWFSMNHLVTSMTSRFTMAIEAARSTLK